MSIIDDICGIYGPLLGLLLRAIGWPLVIVGMIGAKVQDAGQWLIEVNS